MKARFKVLTFIFLIPFGLSIALSLACSIDKSDTGAPGGKPEIGKSVITGRILRADKTPIAGISVSVSEASTSKWGNDAVEYYEPAGELKRVKNGVIFLQEGKIFYTLRVTDGKTANPSATTDSNGRFKIIADTKFWETTGSFTVNAGLLPGTTTNVGVLRQQSGEPFLITGGKNDRRIDLGDIVVDK